MITKNTKPPISMHILNTPIVVYIDEQYHPNKYITAIRNHCGEEERKEYMMEKNGWNQEIIALIECEKAQILKTNKHIQREQSTINSCTDG